MAGRAGLVTAAGSGMGRAGAARLAREGATVCMVDRDGSALKAAVTAIREAGGKAVAIEADLRDDAAARDIVTQAEQQIGSIDFLWNHVGHPGPAAVETIEIADWEIAVDLNLRSPLLTTSAVLPGMRNRRRGSILFTASASGIIASSFSPVYSTAKFGVIGLAKGLAKRFARDGIRVNAICPGPIDTPMLRVFVARPDSATPNEDTEALVQRFGATTAMGRAGQPEEVAAAALFLLSDEASFITGIAMPVDGGLTA